MTGRPTVSFSDCLDPPWGAFARLGGDLVAPGFAGEVGLFHDLVESLAKEVVDAEDDVAYVLGVNNTSGCMQYEDTLGCKPVLDELAVDVERAEHIGKVEQDLFLPSDVGRFRYVCRYARDGLCSPDWISSMRDGFEAVVTGHGGVGCGCVGSNLTLSHHVRQ